MLPPFLLFLSPVLIALELAQLILAERYFGVKQIEVQADVRRASIGPTLACCWSLAIFGNWIWMAAMLPMRFGSGQVACMLLTSIIGYAIRRNCRFKWVLMTLTFEGAIRMGMHVSLLSLASKMI